MFDLIVGTSTGGILACGLGFGLSCTDMVGLYLGSAERIFRRTLWRRVKTGFGLLDAKYPTGPLRDVLAERFGDAPLSSARTRVMTTAADMVTHSPMFFKSWGGGESGGGATFVDAACATACAPTYFDPHEMETPTTLYRLVDGGIYATNPAACAEAEACRLWPGEEYMVVSVGTGRFPERPSDPDGGLRGWAGILIDSMLGRTADVVDYQLRHRLGVGRYLRLQADLGMDIPMDETRPERLKYLVVTGARLGRGPEMRNVLRALKAARRA